MNIHNTLKTIRRKLTLFNKRRRKKPIWTLSVWQISENYHQDWFAENIREKRTHSPHPWSKMSSSSYADPATQHTHTASECVCATSPTVPTSYNSGVNEHPKNRRSLFCAAEGPAEHQSLHQQWQHWKNLQPKQGICEFFFPFPCFTRSYPHVCIYLFCTSGIRTNIQTAIFFMCVLAAEENVGGRL